MEREHREAAHAKYRRLREPEDDDGEAIEVRDWFDEWAKSTRQQEESNNNQRSKE